MLYCTYVVASDRYTKTCCSTKHGEREVTSLYIHVIFVMVPSLLYVVASVELNEKYKIKMVNTKRKAKTQYETPKPLLSKKTALGRG